MTLFLHYILPALISFALAAILTPFIRQYAIRRNILDRTNTAIHKYRPATPKLGGIVMFISFIITTLIFFAAGYLNDSKISSSTVLWLLAALIVLMLGGYLDDRYNLKPLQHVWFPVVAVGLAVFGAGIEIGYVTNPFVAGTGPYGRSLLYLNTPFIGSFGFGGLLAFGWLLFTSYATKFLDGIEGLVSGLGAIASAVVFFVSLLWDVPLSGTSTLVAIFGGSLLGVWIYNVRPLHIFLGDSGPLFIGFMLGVLSIISGAKIATVLLVFGLPLLDSVIVVLARIMKGKNPFLGDRRHLHFKLLDAGLSHKEVLGIYYVFALVFGLSALFLASTDKVIAVSVMAIVVVVLALGVTLAQRSKNQ